ncbi:MAG: polyprenol monophosphomannose synthase [Chitinispirillaceae bacterium]|jgi:dolichol-phosphate mannosyltransferase|nr:polyprenol monophosphomannose synthase [Chitinispirillaceae bacterium]
MTSDILIIIPTYNEIENIGLLIPEIRKMVPDAHVLVVDDGSPDGTSRFVKDLALENVFVLDRSKKEGLGKAYVAGFKWALERQYQYVFEMDADFSHDPKYLPDFLEAIKTNDLVIGSRYKSGVNVVNWPMKRLLLSYFANMYARIVTGIPVYDCTGGFKCFRRKVLESLVLDSIASSGYSFQIEVNYSAWKKRFRILEIPIVFTDRKLGTSKMSSGIIKEAFLIVLWKLRIVPLFHRKQ